MTDHCSARNDGDEVKKKGSQEKDREVETIKKGECKVKMSVRVWDSR